MELRIPDKDEVITPDELVKLTKMSKDFWSRCRVEGDSPLYIRMSATAIRYRWGDVVDWMEQRKCKSTSDHIYYNSLPQQEI